MTLLVVAAYVSCILVGWLVLGALCAHWIGKRISMRAVVAVPPPLPAGAVIAPAAPAVCVTQIHWWNGCTSEVTRASGIHGANAIAYICSEQPRARA